MRESKRKKLHAKGWKIGTPKDFLGMSDEEESYVNLRLRLAEGLKTRRQAHGVTQIGLAQAIKSSHSRVARWRRATQRCLSTCSSSHYLHWVRRTENWRRSFLDANQTERRRQDQAICGQAGLELCRGW